MNVQPAVRKETAKIAIGTAILALVMIAIFALLGQLDYTVWLGTLLGSAAAILNFFLMAMSVQRAAETMNNVTLPPYPEEDEEEGDEAKPEPPAPEVLKAKQKMQLSYTGRMLFLVAVGIVALSVPCFHPIPTVLAMLFPRIVIMISGLRKPNKEEA